LKDENTKKVLKAQYSDREIIGGVFLIRNTISGKALLDSSVDIRGSKNRFEFAQMTGSCVNPKKDKWGRSGFVTG